MTKEHEIIVQRCWVTSFQIFKYFVNNYEKVHILVDSFKCRHHILQLLFPRKFRFLVKGETHILSFEESFQLSKQNVFERLVSSDLKSKNFILSGNTLKRFFHIVII